MRETDDRRRRHGLHLREWKPVVEWTGAGVFVAWNLYGPGVDEILVRNQPNTAGCLYYHLDAMGNVVFLLSQGSQAMMGLEKYTYDAFGKPTITGWNGNVRPVSNYGNRFLFTGREYLYTLGIYDYRHRHYHPGLGRFIQTDPIGFKGDAMNLYRYCRGNPITHSDPDGLLTRDFMWDFASFTDSGNNLQGTFTDYTNKWYAGENGGGGGDSSGGNKSISAESEGKKVGWSDEGNRNQHEPVVVKDGQSYNALTEDAVRVTATNDTLTAHYIVNVRYSDKVGPHNKEKQRLEPDHGKELDRDFRHDRGPKIVESLTRHGGPFEGQSIESARSMLERRLDMARQAVHDASRERHDNVNPLKGPLGDHVLIHRNGLNY